MTVAPGRKNRPGKAWSWTRTRERRSHHPMCIIAVVCAFLAWASVLLVVLTLYLAASAAWRMGSVGFLGPFIIASVVAAVAFGSFGTVLGVLAQLRTRGRYRWATIASLGALAAIVTLRMILLPSPL